MGYYPVFKNFIEVKLAAPVTEAATTIRVTDIDKFPNTIEAGQFFPCVISNASRTLREIVYAVGVDKDNGTLDVERAKEGTVALNWPVEATYFYHAPTASCLDRLTSNVLTVHGINGRASVQVDNDLDGEEEDHRVGLESNSAGNAGIYDFTEGKWLIWSDKDGVNRLVSNTFIYSPDNGSSPLHNMSFIPMLDVRDFGAVGDGVTDDYAAIQAALNQAHTTKKMLVIPAGTYLTNKHLEIGSNTTIFGYGATIKRGFNIDASNYGSTVWLVRNSSADPVCSNVHVFGLTFDNNGGSYNTSSQNIVTIGGKTSQGVTESFTANDISFIDCIFEKWINNHAMDVASTKGLKVIRCIFRGVKYDKSLVAVDDVYAWKRREAIQLDDSPVVANYNSDWLIDGNLFEGIDSTFVAPRVGIGQHGGENFVDVSYKNIKIVNNTFLGCGYAAITLFGVSDSVVSNNYIKDTFYGIEFNSRYSSQNGTLYKIQTNNVVIKGNMFVQRAYNKYSGQNVPFDPGNTSTTYYADCFRFVEAHDNVEGSGVDFSAIPFGSDNITITDNSFAGYYVTFRSYGVTNTKICGNIISDCQGTLSGAASATDVSGNIIVNGGYGIRFSPTGWGYAPNDNNASICRNISVKDNAITIADVNNFKISTIENSNGYDQVTISGNSVHDDFLYSGSPQTSKYFEIKATSASVIAGNVVCAAEQRSTQEIAGTTTGNAVRNNDWFVNGVLQS